MNSKLKIGDLICFNKEKFDLRDSLWSLVGKNNSYFLITNIHKTITGSHQYKLQTFSKRVNKNFATFYVHSNQIQYLKKII